VDRVYRILTESLLSEDLFRVWLLSPSLLPPPAPLAAQSTGTRRMCLSFAPFFASLPFPPRREPSSILSLSLSLSLALSRSPWSPLLICLLGPSPTSGGPTRRPFGQPIPSKVCYTTRRTFENGLPPPSKLFLAPSLARLSSLARCSLRRWRNRGGCDARFIASSFSLSLSLCLCHSPLAVSRKIASTTIPSPPRSFVPRDEGELAEPLDRSLDLSAGIKICRAVRGSRKWSRTEESSSESHRVARTAIECRRNRGALQKTGLFHRDCRLT